MHHDGFPKTGGKKVVTGRAISVKKSEAIGLISKHGARCGEFRAQKVSLDLIERIRLIKPI